ncbi:MAG: putative Ig domain-containing protein, partial [Gemmatimonadales bacterium]
RWRFASWSDGGLRTHPITGSVAGDTLIATLDRDFQLIATAAPGGTISANPPANLSGDFLAEGSTIELTATANSGETFSGWSGDTSTTNAVLTLTMNRAYTVLACFGTVAIASSSPLPDGVMGAAYDQTLQVSCGAGTNWVVTAGALPQGVTLNPSTGRLSGSPRQSGAFSFTVSVMAGGQTLSKPFALSIAAPALTTADVVAHLLGPTAPLTADQLRYLDFLGNNNGTFDIGDFLAWVKATGAP